MSGFLLHIEPPSYQVSYISNILDYMIFRRHYACKFRLDLFAYDTPSQAHHVPLQYKGVIDAIIINIESI